MASLPHGFTITTGRCRLREPSEADIPAIFSATRHPGFNDGMPWDPPDSEADLHPPLQRTRERWDARTAFAFAIERLEERVFVGRISIDAEDAPGVWNIGFMIIPGFEGNGFAIEAAIAIVGFGFSTLQAEVIRASHATWNLRSRRILERLGMKQTAFVPQGFMKKGQWVPELLWEVRKDEWERAQR